MQSSIGADTEPEAVAEELAICALVAGRAPYFGHLRLEMSGTPRDLLIGDKAHYDPASNVRVLDFATSVWSPLFLRALPGQSVTLPSGGEGRVLARRLLWFEGDALVRIDDRDTSFVRTETGWTALSGDRWPRLSAPDGEREADGRRAAAALEESRFDERQRAVLAHRDSPLLVVGGAGCGKTTVALHRLAHLHRRDEQRFAERSLLVVAPEAALIRRAQEILGGLHLFATTCSTFDEWVAAEARRVFPDLPERQSEDRPAAVIAFKRHPALRPVLRQLVEELGLAAAVRLDGALAARGQVVATWASIGEAPLRARLARLEEEVVSRTPPSLVGETRAAFRGEDERLWDVRQDLLELFGDSRLLAAVVAGSGGELGPAMAAELLAHTKVQFSATADEEYADFDPESRRSIDHRSLDEGTPQEDAGTIDPEDHAVCLELLWLKTGGQETPAGALRPRAAVIVDEAQDLAALELAALGRALASRGSLTVCGDPLQQIDALARFAGWQETLAALHPRGPAFTEIQLRQSYRCTAEVAAFAAQVLGPLASGELPGATRTGAPVLRSQVRGPGPALYLLIEGLRELRARSPAASVTVICRRPGTALEIHGRLPPAWQARLALAGELAPLPGLQITTAAQAKGMELDLVVIPDADAATYPDDAASRRTLYVACTRARHQLWVIAGGAPSPLLPPAG